MAVNVTKFRLKLYADSAVLFEAEVRPDLVGHVIALFSNEGKALKANMLTVEDEGEKKGKWTWTITEKRNGRSKRGEPKRAYGIKKAVLDELAARGPGRFRVSDIVLSMRHFSRLQVNGAIGHMADTGIVTRISRGLYEYNGGSDNTGE